MEGKRLRALRREYEKAVLDDSTCPENPLSFFHQWMEEAINARVPDANAMVLSTASDDGQPSSRIVLLKDYDEEGFMFFTNYNSRKGRELQQNSKAALLFFWEPLQRQLRIEGEVEKLSDTESDEYFLSRPEESRISAIASPQSTRITDRKELEQLWNEVREASEVEDMGRPGYWGGYRLKPLRFEFWQGRLNRLHDRVEYEHTQSGWKRHRLAP